MDREPGRPYRRRLHARPTTAIRTLTDLTYVRRRRQHSWPPTTGITTRPVRSRTSISRNDSDRPRRRKASMKPATRTGRRPRIPTTPTPTDRRDLHQLQHSQTAPSDFQRGLRSQRQSNQQHARMARARANSRSQATDRLLFDGTYLLSAMMPREIAPRSTRTTIPSRRSHGTRSAWTPDADRHHDLHLEQRQRDDVGGALRHLGRL